MSTKPAALATWDSNGTNSTPPTGGHQLNGYAVNEIPTSTELNGWMSLQGGWSSFVNDIFTPGGPANGDMNIGNGAGAGGTITAAGLITGNAGVAAGVNQHMFVTGTGLYKHGLQTIEVPLAVPITGVFNPGAGFCLSFSGGSANTMAMAPFVLPIGKRILAIRAVIQDGATGPTKVNVGLRVITQGFMSGAGLFGAGAASSGAGTVQTIASSALTTIVAAGNTYWANILNITGAATCTIFNVQVDYDQP